MATNYQVKRGTDVGSLKLSQDELSFTPKGEKETTTIGWDQLEKHQSNPPKNAKAMIKLVSKDGTTLTLQVKNRSILDELQQDITKRKENFKPKTEEPEIEPDQVEEAAENDSQTTVYEKVSLASNSGSITLSDEGLVFQPNDKGKALEINWFQVKKHQSSPPKIPKAMLKIVLANGKNHNFQLTDRKELKKIYDDVTLRIQNHKNNNLPEEISEKALSTASKQVDDSDKGESASADENKESKSAKEETLGTDVAKEGEPGRAQQSKEGEYETKDEDDTQESPDEQPPPTDEANHVEEVETEALPEQQSISQEKKEEETVNAAEVLTEGDIQDEAETVTEQKKSIDEGQEEHDEAKVSQEENMDTDAATEDKTENQDGIVPEEQSEMDGSSENQDKEGEDGCETTAQEKGQTSKEDNSIQESSQSPKEETESKENESIEDGGAASGDTSDKDDGNLDTSVEENHTGSEGNEDVKDNREGEQVVESSDPAQTASARLVDYSKQKAIFDKENTLDEVDASGGADMDDSIDSLGGYGDGDDNNINAEAGAVENQEDDNQIETKAEGETGLPNEDEEINSEEEEEEEESEYGEGGFGDDVDPETGEPYPDEDLFEAELDPVIGGHYDDDEDYSDGKIDQETGGPYHEEEYPEREIDPETGEPYPDEEFLEGGMEPETGELYLDDDYSEEEIYPETGEPYGAEEYFEGEIDPQTEETYQDELSDGGIDPETGEPYLDDEEPPEGDIDPETGEPYSSPFGEELYDEDEEESEEEEHMSSLLVGSSAEDDESFDDEDFDVLSGKPIKVVEDEQEEEDYYDDIGDHPRIRRSSEFAPDDDEAVAGDSDTEETPFFDDNDDSEYGGEQEVFVPFMGSTGEEEGEGSYSGSEEPPSEDEETNTSEYDDTEDESDDSESIESSSETSSSSSSSESSDSTSDSDSDSEEDYESEEEEEEVVTEYQDPVSAWLIFAERGDEAAFPEAEVPVLKRKSRKKRKKKRAVEGSEEEYYSDEEYMEEGEAYSDEEYYSDEIDEASYSDESGTRGESTEHSVELELDVNDLSVQDLESALATKLKAEIGDADAAHAEKAVHEMLQSLREDLMHGSGDLKGKRKHPGMPEDFYDWAKKAAMEAAGQGVLNELGNRASSSLPLSDPEPVFDWTKFSKEENGAATAESPPETVAPNDSAPKTEKSVEAASEDDASEMTTDAGKPTDATATANGASAALPLQPYDDTMVERWTLRPKVEDPEVRYFNWKGFTNARRPTTGKLVGPDGSSGSRPPFDWKKYAKKQSKIAKKNVQGSGPPESGEGEGSNKDVVRNGLDLLKKVMSTKEEPERKAVLNQHLGPAPSPEQAEGHVTPDDLLEAIAKFVEMIRTVKQSDNAPEITSARQVAILARIAIIEQYGEDSEALQTFQMGLQPAFAPKFENQ